MSGAPIRKAAKEAIDKIKKETPGIVRDIMVNVTSNYLYDKFSVKAIDGNFIDTNDFGVISKDDHKVDQCKISSFLLKFSTGFSEKDLDRLNEDLLSIILIPVHSDDTGWENYDESKINYYSEVIKHEPLTSNLNVSDITIINSNDKQPVFSYGNINNQIMSIFTHKGGVGKTTIAYNLASMSAKILGKTILLIDGDPQMNLTQSILGDEKFNYYIGELPNLSENPISTLFEKTGCKKFIIDSGVPNVDLYLGSYSDSETDLVLGSTFRGGNSASLDNLRDNLLDLKEAYDVVLIDLAPALSPLTKAFLLCSDTYITPLTMDAFCLTGMNLLIQFYDGLTNRFKSRIPLHLGSIINKVSIKTQKIIRKEQITFTQQFHTFKLRLISQVQDNQYVNSSIIGCIPNLLGMTEKLFERNKKDPLGYDSAKSIWDLTENVNYDLDENNNEIMKTKRLKWLLINILVQISKKDIGKMITD
jgi:cellulose biosynthesis protein BcsQ